jgi:hypothetical protein
MAFKGLKGDIFKVTSDGAGNEGASPQDLLSRVS